jgi:hypothetical protein
MIGTPIFNVRTCDGMSGKSSEFKNSFGLSSKCNTSAPQQTEEFLEIIFNKIDTFTIFYVHTEVYDSEVPFYLFNC